MLLRLFKKVEGKQQTVIDKEDTIGKMLTDDEDCVPIASVTQPPVEHIAESISKLEDNDNVDNFQTGLEFPKDVISSDKRVTHTQIEVPGDTTILDKTRELEVSLPCSSTSSDELGSLSVNKCILKEETPGTHESSSNSSTSSDEFGSLSVNKCIPKEETPGTHESSSNSSTSSDEFGSLSVSKCILKEETPGTHESSGSLDETEEISARDGPESCELDVTANLEGDVACDSHRGRQNEEATCASSGTDTPNESSIKDDTGAENQRSSNSFSELGFQGAKIHLPVAGGISLHKCKSETVLHTLAGTRNNKGSLTEFCPKGKKLFGSFDTIPVLCEGASADTKNCTLIDSKRVETDVDRKKSKNDVELNPKKNLKSVKPKIKNKPPIKVNCSGSEIFGMFQSTYGSEEALDVGDEIVSGHKRELFIIHPCQYPYPCCTHCSCLYNQRGKLCTIFGRQYIFTEVEQIPILVSLESEDVQEIALQCCKILWRGTTPLALSNIEDGTEVMFDAMVMPDSRKYVAIIVWHTNKPDDITLPMKESLILLEEVTGFQVQLVSFNMKKTGVIKAFVDGQEETITFSLEVVFLNGKKATNKEDVTLLFQFPLSVIYTTLNKFLLIGSTDNYVYKPTCIWIGKKPNSLLLQPQSKQGKPYSLNSSSYIVPEVHQYTTLHCDVPCMLSVTKATKKEFELKCILDNEVKSLPCKPEMLYSGNSQVSQIRSRIPFVAKVKAHILKHRMKRGRESWSLITVQVPDEVVAKSMTSDETTSSLDSSQKGPQNSEYEFQGEHDSSTVAESEEIYTNDGVQNSVRPLSATYPTSQSVISHSDSIVTQEPSCDVSVAPLHASVVAGSTCLQVSHTTSIQPDDRATSFSIYPNPLSNCHDNPTASCQFSPGSHQYSTDNCTTEATQCQDTSLKLSRADNAVSDNFEGEGRQLREFNSAAISRISDDSPPVAQLSSLQTTPVLGNNSKTGLLIETQTPPIEIPPSSASANYSNSSSPGSQQYFSPCLGSPLSSNSSYTSSHVSYSKLCESTPDLDAASLPETKSKTNIVKAKTSTVTRGCSSLESVSCVYKDTAQTSWRNSCYPWSFGVPVPVGMGASSSGARSGQSLNMLIESKDTLGKLQSGASNITKQPSSSIAAYSQVVKKVAKSEPPPKVASGIKQCQVQPQKANNIKAQTFQATPQKAKLFMISCKIQKLAANTGILIAKGKILSATNPMAHFHHKVLFVNGVSLTSGDVSLFRPSIEAYENAEWTCLLQKCKQQNISNLIINFTTCLMWSGKLPTKPYNKLLLGYDIVKVSSSQPPISLTNKKPSNGPQNLPAATSSKSMNPKPVIMNGVIKTVNQQGTTGIVEGVAKTVLPFTRNVCYLYDVCLQAICLNDVVSSGIRVQYEYCSGKVMKIYIGNSYSHAGNDPETSYYLLSAWCRQYKVPLKSKEILLLSVGWLPPELGPLAPTSTETKNSVVDLQ